MFNIQEMYNKTIDFAAKAHAGQKVPGKEYSYIVHIVNVAMEVSYTARKNHDLDEELMMQVSLLHDILEDTDITYEEIMEKFGKKIADGAKALSKNKEIEKEKRMSDSLNRIKSQPYEIWIVKMADRITNLQHPPDNWTVAKKQSYLAESKLIYNELKEADDYTAERLKWKIKNYENFINE